MAKQYAEPAAYEAKLEKVMDRLGVEQYDYEKSYSYRSGWLQDVCGTRCLRV